MSHKLCKLATCSTTGTRP